MLGSKSLMALTIAGTLILGFVQAVKSADELGRCIEFGSGNPSTPPEEVPTQKCVGLFNCYSGDAPNLTCQDLESKCPGTAEQQKTKTLFTQTRVIQIGDCNLATSTDKCFECANPKSIVCGVRYNYQQKVTGNCAQRCDMPTVKMTMGTGHCKP